MIEEKVVELGTTEQVEDYYAECWTNRIEAGHNNESLAIHQGLYTNGDENFENAKLNLNNLLAKEFELDKEPGKLILDAGCGVGGSAIYLANMYPELRVIGVNISKPQVESARIFAEKRLNQASVEFYHKDYTHLQMPGEMVDSVYAVESICHTPQKQAFYREAHSILKARGKLVLIDYFMINPPLADSDLEMLHNFQSGWQIADCHENYLEELAIAGFENVQLTDLSKDVQKGIARSHNKAIEKLSLKNVNYSGLMMGHLKACIALRHLVSRKIISYCVLTASKA